MSGRHPERPNPLDALGIPHKGEKRRTAPQEHREEKEEPVLKPAARTGRPPKEEEERREIKITLYLNEDEYNQIEELRSKYWKRKRKRLSVNALLREMIKRAQVEDLF